MSEQTKEQLLERLQTERQQWETLLHAIGTECMTQPGVTDTWTCKDAIAHLTTWWRREVAGLENVRRGEPPQPHPSQQDVQVINNWVYYTNRDRPLAVILQEAVDVWKEFAESIQALPERDLMEPGRFAWLPDAALGPQTLNNFVTHFHEEHEEMLRTWLNKLEQSSNEKR
jgi:hypothetical protein